MPVEEEVLEWVERVASFCADEWGLAPITGRIFGWLLICDPPEQSAADIAAAIGASRASLTSNMRLLLAIHLVRKVSRPGERTTYYRIEDDAWTKVVRGKLIGLAAFGSIAEDGARLAGGDPERTQRLRTARESSAWLAKLAEDLGAR
ncbi:GbsR/MarR family transcriptional regulator [Amycolatopsis anabasis]|uniref:GbsR/MarR family transcriptional regulator n=1 Tax=Amycolatopsis anabasis TaxID=1840409 RepID=UPI00131C68B6|nr:transcriptional regulator [Amycolatopsis anabasis]